MLLFQLLTGMQDLTLRLTKPPQPVTSDKFLTKINLYKNMKTWNQFLSELANPPPQPGQPQPQPGQPQQPQPGQPQKPGQNSSQFILKDPTGKPMGSRSGDGTWTTSDNRPVPLKMAQAWEQQWMQQVRQSQQS